MTDGMCSSTMVNMTWPEIQSAVDRNALVLLPLGVIEEHGPHLCLGTDIYTAHLHSLFVRQTLEEKGYPVVIAPPFFWDVCQSTSGFIGSFQIKKETAKALLVDILASLAQFGFNRVVGINAHGDIEQNVTILEAFSAAVMQHYGLTGEEPYLCPVEAQTASVSASAVPDVHAGDIETATMHHFYPALADAEKARSLPPVQLGEDKIWPWLLGGQAKDLSPNGYVGAPADFEQVDVLRNITGIAERVAEAIVARFPLT
ncbi:MAG TPA: creatininase family protein [Anaerolinea sp.]|nr:creatininase family protein [Anaerolinea sp.]